MLFQKSFSLRCAEREAAVAFREVLEKAAPALAHSGQMLPHRRPFHAKYAQHIFGVARQFFKLIARHTPSEVIARNIFDLVSFVKYDSRIFGQDRAEIVLPYRQVGKK